jgi:CBS domain-containing protein
MGLFASIRNAWRRHKIRGEITKLRSLTVADIMTKYVITVKPDDEVVKAATKMIAEDISCLVAFDGDKAVGVISERDFLRKVPLSKAVFSMKVKDIMSANLISVTPGTKLTDAVALMKEKHIRRLLVMEEGRLLGVVTQTDFTRAIGKMLRTYPAVEALSAARIMTRDVVGVTPKNSVAQAKEKMLKADVGAIIIMDKDQVAGIFTEYDIVMQFYDQHGKLEMNDIAKYMRKYVRAVPMDTSVFAANRLMLEKNMRRLLVTDNDAKIAGIVTQTDICRFVYTNVDLIEKSLDDPKADLRCPRTDTQTRGEFKTEHLRVYTVQ